MQHSDGVHWPQDVPQLTTARLRLRAVHPARDAAGMLRLLGDPEVTRFGNAPRCTTLAEAQAALEQFPQRFAAKEMIRWAIQPPGHGEAIGTVGLLRVNHEHCRGELGYDLARCCTLRDYLCLGGGFHSCRFFSLLATDAGRPAVAEAAAGR